MRRFLLTTVASAALVTIAPRQSVALPPLGFTLSPAVLSFSAQATGGQTPCVSFGTYQYVTVTVTTMRPIVIGHPAIIAPDAEYGDGCHAFSDTQGGTCWQQYEALGNRIPAHTSCTIEVGFHPESATTYNATLTVTRCTDWMTDPTYGFLVCTAFDGSASIDLSGTGT
jgi:hypothetical protein